MRYIIFVASFLLIAINFPETKSTTPGNFIVEPSTLRAVGFEWYIEGDVNKNAEVRVKYKRAESEKWKEYISLLRIGNERVGVPEWEFTTNNMFAGSIMGLEPGTAYKCKFTLSDPDGVNGDTARVVTVRTRERPEEYDGGEVRHVYPEDWSGKKKEPAYRGLLHAYYGYPRFADWQLTTDPVEPGDKVIVHGGEYKAEYKNYRDYHGVTFHGTYRLTRDGSKDRPIVIKAAKNEKPVFDGNDASVLFDITSADYNHIKGLTIKNTETAIRAGLMNAHGSDGLVVQDCHFKDIGIGVQGLYEGSKYYYISDNVFVGREDTSKVYHSRLVNGERARKISSYYAVKLHGQGHTVSYNKVKYFFDGIDISTHSKPETEQSIKSVSIDFYNNDIFVANDNCIEADGGTHNIRILRNRCFNTGQQALSNQPVLGGPVYWIRNIVYNSGNASTFKFWGMRPSGILAFHNTSTGILTRDDKPASNVKMYNNLFLPSDQASMPTLGMYTYTSYSSLDYNGYRYREPFIGWQAPPEGSMYDYNSESNPTRFTSLDTFADSTGQEQHGIVVDYDIFKDVSPPTFSKFQKKHSDIGRVYPVYHPQNVDFSLKPGSKAVDAGKVLPGINGDYTGDAPDLGALEYGREAPHYGPRE